MVWVCPYYSLQLAFGGSGSGSTAGVGSAGRVSISSYMTVLSLSSAAELCRIRTGIVLAGVAPSNDGSLIAACATCRASVGTDKAAAGTVATFGLYLLLPVW